MKQLTNKEYTEYMKYKEARASGQILTPDGLRVICESQGNDPEKIGLYILESLHRIQVAEKGPSLRL